MRRTIAAVVLALIATVLAPLSAEAAGPLNWGSCPAGTPRSLQCAYLQVPLDHANPGGQQITLALSRKAHTSADYKGAILTNPGGPGGEGLDLPATAAGSFGAVGAKYDWIGLDIRGVGASTPKLTCDSTYFNPRRPAYVPKRQRIVNLWLARAQRYADSCKRGAGAALLPHMTTETIARDVESVRLALGLPKLSFYGFSYGSYLGQVYATLFPGSVDKMVLDGVVNPERVWYGSNIDQDYAFDRNMDAFWRYLAAYPKAFKLGKRPMRIKKRYYRMLNRLTKRPIRKLGPAELNDAMTSAGYYVFQWSDIGRALSVLVRKKRIAPMMGLYATSNMGDDNTYAVYNAVQCTDAAWPGAQQTFADAWGVHRAAPFMAWSNTWYNAPCMSWPAPSRQPVAVSGAALTNKVLLVSETYDAATPFSGAVRVKQLFPTASLVEGVNGTTHSGSLSAGPCVTNAIAAYLESGQTPVRTAGSDLQCAAIAPPRP